MGDEELNFTEEEARCWADDPRNQAHDNRAAVGIIGVGVLLLITLFTFTLTTNSGRSGTDGGVSHGGETEVGTTLVR